MPFIPVPLLLKILDHVKQPTAALMDLKVALGHTKKLPSNRYEQFDRINAVTVVRRMWEKYVFEDDRGCYMWSWETRSYHDADFLIPQEKDIRLVPPLMDLIDDIESGGIHISL